MWWRDVDIDDLQGEIPWQVFEDFRLWLWLLEYWSQTGFDTDTAGITGATEFAAYVNSLENRTYYAGDAEFVFVKYRHSSEQEYDWFHLSDTGGLSRGTLASLTPLTDATTLRAMWKYAALPNRYQDWNRNSQRYVARKSTATVDEVEYISSACEPAYKWAMRQTDARRQRDLIHYQDSERKIPHLKSDPDAFIDVPVEFAARYVTQPDTLGPNFDEVYHQHGLAWVHTKRVEKEGVEKDVGIVGRQYAISGGLPNEDLINATYPWFSDPKNNEALQNQIERVVSLGFWWRVDPATPQGEAFQINYGRHLNNNGDAVLAWDEEGIYNTGDVVFEEVGSGVKFWKWVNPFFDYSTPGNSALPPSQETFTSVWEFVGYLPQYAPADSDYWGCNGSAFELFLWLTGDYDWWFDTSHPYIPKYILEKIYKDGLPIPEPTGTWRRTWRFSMGGPKSALDDGRMRNSDYTPEGDAVGPVYSSVTYPFFSLFTNTLPTFDADAEELADLHARHGHRLRYTGVRCYEFLVDLLKHCRDVMAYAKYQATEAYVQQEVRHDEGNGYGDWTYIGGPPDYAGGNFGRTEYSEPAVSGSYYSETQCRLRVEATRWDANWLDFVGGVFVRTQIYGENSYTLGPTNHKEDKLYGLPDGQTGVAVNRLNSPSISPALWQRMTANEHFIEISAGDITQDETYTYLPIEDKNPTAPDTSGLPLPPPPQYWIAFSRAFLVGGDRMEEMLLSLDLNKTPESVVNNTGYWQFTEVEEDPTLFDDNGYLMETL